MSVDFRTFRKTGASRTTRARRGLRRHLSLVQKQVLARYLFYYALPITAMFAVGIAMEGGRRAITLLAMLALMRLVGSPSTAASPLGGEAGPARLREALLSAPVTRRSSVCRDRKRADGDMRPLRKDML